MVLVVQRQIIQKQNAVITIIMEWQKTALVVQVYFLQIVKLKLMKQQAVMCVNPLVQRKRPFLVVQVIIRGVVQKEILAENRKVNVVFVQNVVLMG